MGNYLSDTAQIYDNLIIGYDISVPRGLLYREYPLNGASKT